jgi:hypothetical protein
VPALDTMHHLYEATSTLAADMPNPLDGVSPNLGPFKPLFDAKWKQALGMVWFGYFIYSVWQLIRAIGEAAGAKQVGFSDTITTARQEITKNLWVIAGLVAAPLIVAGVITFVG